ncbi:MAG: CpaF family protein [Deltaproteobacteria bacterium]
MIPAHVYEKSLRSFLEPILSYLDDPSVSEVMINGPECIYVERRGQLTRVDARFSSQEALLSALRNIAQFVGRPLDHYHPILEGRLPDGSRIEALLPPISPDGPSVAIRRFSKDTLTIEKLLSFGSLTPDSAQLLSALVGAKQNVIVSGGTGSGKTSLLNCLSSFIPEGDRVVVIEDARELQMQQAHVVQLEGRPADARGKGQITIRDLFKATLRMRPDRIVVGEIRGGEALELIQAMTSGHGGCMSTVHASYPKDSLSRLETMALMSGIELPLSALRSQISSAIDIIVQVGRVRDGSRRVTHITEVTGCDEHNQYQLQDLFVLEHGDNINKPAFVPTGVLPDCLEAIRTHGHELPPAIYAAAKRRQR